MDRYRLADRERFARVMTARKTARELIGLAEKLAASEKFAISSKPYCFADFIQTCTERVPASALDALLNAIDQIWVGSTIRSVMGTAETDSVVRGLVRRVLEASTTDDVLERRICKMRAGSLIRSEAHALVLAIEAGLSKAEQSRLAAALARLAARPKVEELCPF